jgi:Zn finger protein HypA/HybF involved in hydrogenase expression
MHELSLVQGIIESIQEAGRERGKTVSAFEVRVGELAQFDLRVVRELLREMKRGTSIEGAKAKVLPEKARIKCLGCGSTWGFKDIVGPMPGEEREVVHFFPELVSSYSRCPKCSKSYFEIEEGRGVRIAGVTFSA